jgi:hypothetical protein
MGRKSSNPRYPVEREERLIPWEGGLEHRAMIWCTPRRGKPKEVAVSYQVRAAGRWVEIVRYDSCHGHFHRHKAHFGEPGEIDLSFGNLPMLERKRVAVQDIERNARFWQRLIPAEELE